MKMAQSQSSREVAPGVSFSARHVSVALVWRGPGVGVGGCTGEARY